MATTVSKTDRKHALEKPIYRHAQPGCSFRVIGAGLPRTGTVSFMAAVSYLLDGPDYHAGRRLSNSATESDILNIMDMCQATLRDAPQYDDQVGRSADDKEWWSRPASPELKRKLRKLLDGYVATADPPMHLLYTELLEMYPDAIVICTTRPCAKWVPSILMIYRVVVTPTLRAVYFFMPNLRHLLSHTKLCEDIQASRLGKDARIADGYDEKAAVIFYERHHARLRALVPPDKLFFVDVKDGWGPLCKVLGVEVPAGVPFPRLNEGKEIERTFAWLWRVVAALCAGLLGVIVLIVAVGWRYWQRR